MIRRYINRSDRELEYFVLCPRCQQHEPIPVHRFAEAKRVFRTHMATRHADIRRYDRRRYTLATAFGVWLNNIRNEQPQDV